jgi:hypothetical protein
MRKPVKYFGCKNLQLVAGKRHLLAAAGRQREISGPTEKNVVVNIQRGRPGASGACPLKFMSKNQTSNDAMTGQPSPAVDAAMPPPPPVFAPVTGESERAFEAFRVYLELGPRRRFLVVARKIGVTLRTIRRWAADFDWRGRIQAHAASDADQYARSENALHREALRDAAAHAKNFRDRQHAMAETILDIAERYLKRVEDADLDQLRFTDACRALYFASRIVRQTHETDAAASPDQGLRDQLTALLDQACRETASTHKDDAPRANENRVT